MLTHAIILVFTALVLAGAMSDAARFTIPNWLCGLIVLTFPAAAFAAGLGWPEIGLHLLGGLIAFLIGFALFGPGWIGGGDAKMFAAAALWFGWPMTLEFLLHTVIAGGVLALVLLALRHSLVHAPALAGRIAGSALAKDAPVPYGIAIAAGALWTLPSSAVFASI